MLAFLRHRQQGIMIFVAVAVIISFAWFFNPYDARYGNLTATDAFRMDGKAVTVKEIQRQARLANVASSSGFSFIYQLIGQNSAAEFTQNRMLLRKKGRELGIEPTEDEVNKALREHSSFQTAGKFDADRYDDVLKNTFLPNGLQPGDLRALVADQLIMDKLNALVASNAIVPDSLINVAFQRTRETVTASVVDFKLADAKSGIEITDEQVKNRYEENKANLLSEEKRKVEYVFFPEPPMPAEAPPAATLPPSIAVPPADDAPPAEIPPITVPPLDPSQETPAPADDESEAPGQAPEPAVELEELPSLDSLGDVNVSGLTEEQAPNPAENGVAPDNANLLEIPEIPALDMNNLPPQVGGAASAPSEAVQKQHEQDMIAFGNRVDEFYRKLIDGADFKTLASEYGVPHQVTELFTQAAPPADLKMPTELIGGIFSADARINKGIITPIEGINPKGYYVVHITETAEPKELTLAEATDKVKEALLTEEAKKKLEASVKEAHDKLTEAIKGGKTFEDAAKELNLTPRTLEPFALNKQPTGVDHIQQIIQAINKTATGSVSELQAVPIASPGAAATAASEESEDALIVFVHKRQLAPTSGPATTPATTTAPGAAPQDPATDFKTLAESTQRTERARLFRVWLTDARSHAKIAPNPAVPEIPALNFGRQF